MLSGVADEEVNFRTKTGCPIPSWDIRVVIFDMKDVAHDGKRRQAKWWWAPVDQGYYQTHGGRGTWYGGSNCAHQIGSPHVAAWLSADTRRIKA